MTSIIQHFQNADGTLVLESKIKSVANGVEELKLSYADGRKMSGAKEITKVDYDKERAAQKKGIEDKLAALRAESEKILSSAKGKLVALGLSEEEVNALIRR